jgi:segregation and condensation protein A
MKPDLTLVGKTGTAAAQAARAAPFGPTLPAQAEMPFAVVEGQPITEMPRDLYIPPQALEVFLEAFEGPLDMLLYLIRRQNLDILDIPIAEITRQYMRYIELMQVLQLELAGEYLLMAATLAEVKSRMLLPRPKREDDSAEADPRAELVRRLQEYERFKRAAEGIDRIARLERDTWLAAAELTDRKVVLSSLSATAFVDFVRLFRADEGRRGVTVTFIAVLELLREGLIEIVQSEAYGPLHVRLGGSARHLTLVADAGADPAANEDLARPQ